MSGDSEPDVAGSSMHSTTTRSLFGRRSTTNVFPAEIKIPGLDEATSQLSALTGQLQGLAKTLQELSSSQATLSSGLNTMLKGITTNANQAAQAVGGLAGAAAGGGGGGGSRPGGFSLVGALGSAVSSDLFKDLAMFPLRFIQSTVSENRNLAMTAGAALGGTQFATGLSTSNLLKYLGGLPGNVLGSPEDIMNLLAISRQSGALASPTSVMGGRDVTGRGPGFFQAVQQAQVMMPGTPVAQLAGTIGGFAASPAQQQAAYLSGGAFAMLAPGGGMKSISQWAEGILRYLEGQRPGNKRGKPFDHGEILSQYFPGSNIDAWLAANGVPPDMREYWWNYALGKSVRTGTTGGGPLDFEKIAQGEQQANVTYQRLQSTTALTRTGFGLGAQMAGAYANKEVSNKWFNEMVGQMIRDLIPAKIAGSGPLSAMQYMPDTMEQLMMSLLERGGTIGGLLGGYLGWGFSGATNVASTFMGEGGLLGNLPVEVPQSLQDLYSGMSGWLDQNLSGLDPNALAEDPSSLLTQAQDILGAGDVGDIGDGPAWGLTGGKTLAGLHPDLRRKLTSMRRLNPRIKINSGLRTTVQQQRLRSQGYNRVSGKPSAHTRGLAADLGPKSEYPWIVANARKFGLKSGVGEGEPWHVGLGDHIGDPPATTTTTPTTTDSPLSGPQLGGLFNLLTGTASREDTLKSIGSVIPAMMALFFGVFQGGGDKAGAPTYLQFTPDLYKILRDPSKGITPTGFGGTYNVTANASTPSPYGFGGLPGGGGTAAGAASPEAIYAYLRQNGVSQASAAGILANIRYESGFDPTNASGDGGTSGGLFQHHAGRWAALKVYAAGTNRQWTDWQAQVDFALQEARGMGINLTSSDPAAAAREWTMKFERPANPTARANERAAVADEYMFGDVSEGSDRVDPYTQQAMMPKTPLASAALPRLGDMEYLLGDVGNAEAAHMVTPAPLSGPTTNATFNNSFIIQGGSGGVQGQGGVDVRRTVTLIADHLEDEMNKRLARRN